MKKCLAYINHKKANMPILIPDKVDFIVTNGLIHQEDKTIINLYVHNSKKNDRNERITRDIYKHTVNPWTT